MPYPYAYPYPVPAYSYPEYPTYAPPAPVVTQGNQAYGGVSFEITPSDATVTVDGAYVGTVIDFYDPARPLCLTTGTHHVVVDAPGYQPIAFDVNIVPGEGIPYRGDLQAF